jgi:putative ABC transport system substrate-binding protein
MTGRREFITLLGGAAAWPLAARAQQPERMPLVGVLVGYPRSDPAAQSGLTAFTQAFHALGWSQGRNVRIEVRWADGGFGDMQKIAKELVPLGPDVIIALTGAPGVKALVQETSTIPIVFTASSDPVGLGFVQGLARPGGNATGFSLYESSVGTKWLEALKRIAPNVSRIALIFNPETSVPALYVPPIEAAAAAFNIELHKNQVNDPAEIEPVMAAISREPGGGLMFLPDTFMIAHREIIFASAVRYRLPAVYPLALFAASGGLISYGVDLDDSIRRAAVYVDRILKGEKPADLPVQQPTKYDLVINLRTAKTLGLTVPESLIALADEVIE